MPGPTRYQPIDDVERARPPVAVGQPVEVRVVRRGAREPDQFVPEVLQVHPDGVPVAVQQARGKGPAGGSFWYQNSVTTSGVSSRWPAPGHRRADHQRPDALGGLPGDGLGDAAADVVPRQDDQPSPSSSSRPITLRAWATAE